MKKEKIIKVLLIIGVITFGALTLKLVVKYSINEIAISRYNQGKYEDGWIQPNLFLNLSEEYVAHYNLGDIYYRQREYAKAAEAFNHALTTTPEEKQCSVRGNLALARLLDLDTTNKKAGQLVTELQKIAELLLVHDCAKTNGRGTDARDQTIYDAIQVVLGGTDEAETESEETSEEKQEKEDPTQSNTEQEIRKQLEAASQEANNQYDYSDFEVYDGKVW